MALNSPLQQITFPNEKTEGRVQIQIQISLVIFICTQNILEDLESKRGIFTQAGYIYFLLFCFKTFDMLKYFSVHNLQIIYSKSHKSCKTNKSTSNILRQTFFLPKNDETEKLHLKFLRQIQIYGCILTKVCKILYSFGSNRKVSF